METINLTTIIGFSDNNLEKVNYFDVIDNLQEPPILQLQGTFNEGLYKKYVRLKNTIKLHQEVSNDISIYSDKFTKKIEVVDSITGAKIFIDESSVKCFLDAFKTVY